MKVYVKKITNSRLIIPKGVRVFCDKCMEQVTWDAQIDYEDEWGFYVKEEEHYYCVDHLLELAQSKIKKEMIEL